MQMMTSHLLYDHCWLAKIAKILCLSFDVDFLYPGQISCRDLGVPKDKTDVGSHSRRLDSDRYEARYRQKVVNSLFSKRVVGIYYGPAEIEDLAIAKTKDTHQRVKFQRAVCQTYGVQLKRGYQLLLFIDGKRFPGDSDRDRAVLFASQVCLVECDHLDAKDVKSYLKQLMTAETERRIVDPLKKVYTCPGPWQYIIGCSSIDSAIVTNVLDICDAAVKSPSGKRQKDCKKFFEEVCNSQFMFGPLMIVLRDAIEPHESSVKNSVISFKNKLLKSTITVIRHVGRYCPGLIPRLLPLIQMLVQLQPSACAPDFMFELLTFSITGSDPVSVHWTQLPLTTTAKEIKASGQKRMGKSFGFHVLLPCVRKQGPYPNADTYFDTYIRLMREDRLSGLRDAIADLSRGVTEPGQLSAPVLPNIKVIGLQVLQSTPCLSVVVQDERCLAFSIAVIFLFVLMSFFFVCVDHQCQDLPHPSTVQ